MQRTVSLVGLFTVSALVLVACSSTGNSTAPATGGAASAVTERATAPSGQSTNGSTPSETATTGTNAVPEGFVLADRIKQKVSSGQSVNIVVSNQGTGIPVFGAQQKAGVEKACAEVQTALKAACRLAGPVSTNQGQQLGELETLLNGGQVDCLGVGSPEPNAYVNIINKYVKAGIPVFTENTDVPNSRRFAFFAINEESAGQMNGKATADLLKAAGSSPDTVAVGSGNPNAPWAQGRMKGFIEGFKQVFPYAKFFNSETNGLPTGDDFTTQEVIDSVGPFLQANKQVNVFFHTDQGVEGVSKVIEDKKLTGHVFASGFNVSGEILQGLDSGRILATIDQGFDNQAGAVVKACADFLTSGKLPAEKLAYLKPILVTKNGGAGAQSVSEARARLGSS